MLLSLRLVALAALFALPHAPVVAVALDGPNKLNECTSCKPIYQAMVKCQTIKRPGGIGDEITDCICVPNPDGWYPYILKCRDCLSSGSSDFFGNLATMMTQLFTSCTNAGGNVVSDGESICASNAMWNQCASLKDGSESGELSWASFERFSDPSQNSNATQLLDLTVPKESASKSIESSRASNTATTAAPTGTSSQAPSDDTATESRATTAGTGSQAPSPTTDLQGTTTTTAGSSAARLGHGPQTGYVWEMLAAAGLVALLAV